MYVPVCPKISIPWDMRPLHTKTEFSDDAAAVRKRPLWSLLWQAVAGRGKTESDKVESL